MTRRATLVLALCLTALLLPSVAAARDAGLRIVTDKRSAAQTTPQRAQDVQRPSDRSRWERGGREDARHTVPRAAAGGPCTVTGRVLDYYGSPVADADVELSYKGVSGRYTGYTDTSTGTDGRFSFSGVPATSEGRVIAWPSDDASYRRHDLTFAPGVNYFELRPGQVMFQGIRSSDPDWNDWRSMWVTCYGPGGNGGREIAGTEGYAYAMAPRFNYAIVEFWGNEASEVQSYGSPIPVYAGGISPVTMRVFESDARRIWLDKPYWASGPPNTKVTLALGNWPAGFKAQFYGEEDAPADREIEYTGEWTSTGQTARVTLTVPSWVTPGYDFHPHAWRSDDLWVYSDLDIHEWYQVCTLKPSKSSIRRGTWITAGGIIPTQGHWGSRAGLRKTVTLYAHKGFVAAPTKWNPKSQGWIKVYAFKANGYGQYRSRIFAPLKSCTLIVRYPGDDWYFGAYTGVSRVTVR